jgi:hypothetical protein
MQTATPIPAVVPRETDVLLYLAKWALRAVFLLGVTLTLASRAAAAPVVFRVSGGNPDESGLIVSGTVTIDTATGKVLSADVTASHVLDDGSFTEYVFNHIESVRQTAFSESRKGPEVVLTSIMIIGAFDGPSLFLTLEGSLVGFNGSPLFSGRVPVGFESCIEFPGTPYGWAEFTIFGSVEPN